MVVSGVLNDLSIADVCFDGFLNIQYLDAHHI